MTREKTDWPVKKFTKNNSLFSKLLCLQRAPSFFLHIVGLIQQQWNLPTMALSSVKNYCSSQFQEVLCRNTVNLDPSVSLIHWIFFHSNVSVSSLCAAHRQPCLISRLITLLHSHSVYSVYTHTAHSWPEDEHTLTWPGGQWFSPWNSCFKSCCFF